MELAKLKKPIYALSLAIGLLGIFIAMIIAFVVNNSLDKTEYAISKSMDGAALIILNTETTLLSVENEVGTTNKSIAKIKASTAELSSGLKGTGTAISGFSDTLSLLSIAGAGFASSATTLKNSSQSLINTATSLENLSKNLDEHQTNMGDIQKNIGKTRNELETQRKQMGQIKTTVTGIIGGIKLANLLLFVMFLAMFGILITNSIAGVI